VLLAFMAFPLMSRRAARADQPGYGTALNMADDQESASRGIADCDKTTLVIGMIGISKGRGQGIIEHGHGFVEGQAMLSNVRRGLVTVPLETHRSILTYVVSSVRLTHASAAGVAGRLKAEVGLPRFHSRPTQYEGRRLRFITARIRMPLGLILYKSA
jgi:hypothetical protein